MEERIILVKNLQTHYTVFGQGTPLLILHGWESSSEKWMAVGELLSNSMEVIIPDLPGFGKSSELTTAWSIDNYVEWLREFSEKIPQLRNGFYLLGHSFGGAVAAKFSIKYAQRVKKLFLVSAACVRKYTSVKKILYHIAKLVKVFSFLPYYSQFRKAIYKFIIRKSDYVWQNGIMKETYLKVILDDLSYKMNFIKVPTVIIWGDKDASTPIEHARFIHKKLPRAQYEVIPGADHLLHIKIPKVLAQKILNHN